MVRAAAGRLNGLSNAMDLVSWQVVHDDGVARPQRWGESLFDIGQESVAIHGAVQNKRSDQTVGAQSSGECCRLPMSVWDGSTASLAAWRAPVKPRHFGVGAGFVDEDEALRVEIDFPFEPIFPRGIYIAAPLLGGVRCLFLSVIFLRWKKRQSEAMLADIPRRFNRSRNPSQNHSIPRGLLRP